MDLTLNDKDVKDINVDNFTMEEIDLTIVKNLKEGQVDMSYGIILSGDKLEYSFLDDTLRGTISNDKDIYKFVYACKLLMENKLEVRKLSVLEKMELFFKQYMFSS